MKILIIHNNSLFLSGEAINFYAFLAAKQGKIDEYNRLSEKYFVNIKKGPSMLREMNSLLVKGQKISDINNYVTEFWDHNKNKNIDSFINAVKRTYDKVYITTSYPAFLYEGFYTVDKVIGPVYEINNDIYGEMIELSYKNSQKIKDYLKNSEYEDKFTGIPNRYGLLCKVIDEMFSLGIKEENIHLMLRDNNSVTSQPLMHKLASKVFYSMKDFNYE